MPVATQSDLRRRRGITPRAVALGLLLAPLNSFWIHQMVEVQFVASPTVVSLYFNVLFALCLLTLWNALVRRVVPRLVLSTQELLVVYLILVTTSSCSGYDFIHWILPGAAGVHYRATPDNRWQELFFAFLPTRLTMADPTSLRGLYEGGTSFYGTPDAWRPWVGPGLWWSTLMLLTLTATLGLSVLLRRRWVEVEKLPFPIIQLPWELARGDSPIFRDRALWWALGGCLGLNLLNGMHVLRPSMPYLPVQFPGQQAGSEAFWLLRSSLGPPWGGAGDIAVSFFPIAIGFGLLLPTELLASCWFFYVFFKGQLIVTQWLGMRGATGFPFQTEQSQGGFLGIFLFSLWAGRGYLRDALRRVVRPDPERERAEPVSYRAAAMWFGGSVLGLVVLTHVLGMGLWQACVHWAGYFLVAFIVGRVRAEMGLFTHELYQMGPTTVMGNLLGQRLVGSRSLTVASVLYALSRGFRSLLFPHQAEALKLAERSGLDTRRLFRLLLGTAAFGVALAWLVYLPIVYHYGAATAGMGQYSDWYTTEAYGNLSSWLGDPRGLATSRVATIGLGALFFLGLMSLKLNLAWWPVHPLGFALSTTYAMEFVWFCLFLAWLVKWLVSRYAGHEGVRKLVAVAFGLILGDSLGGSFWSIYGALAHKKVYAFFG